MKKPALAAVTVAIAALTLAGCAPAASTAENDGTLSVVATTNVYGDLAAQVGGDRVEVTSIINSSAKDPHAYEASARDRLAVTKADLVIENGGGYDAFMHDLLEGAEGVTVLTAVEYSHDFPGAEAEEEHEEHGADATADHDHESGETSAEHGHDHDYIEGFNEHVWFELPAMSALVSDIARALGELDPEGAAEFDANAATLTAEIAALEEQIEAIKTEANGAGVFLTEPVPGYLVSAAGLTDFAPEGFAAAVEEGRDIAPAMLLAAIRVIESGDVRAVLTNEQTGGAETRKVEETAKAQGLPVVAFGELLPENTTYAEWMQSALDSLAAALNE